MVDEALSQSFSDLVSLNVFALKQVCDYLGIPFHYEIFSNMNLDILPVHDAGEWALHISAALGADAYINPPGGIALFDKEKFQAHSIELSFLEIRLRPYNQKKACFVEGLSVLDVMMFNPPEEIRATLDDFVIIKP